MNKIVNNEIFTDSFEYKLIYLIEINDETHKGLVKIGDTTLNSKKGFYELTPCCHDLNQAAKERIKQYTNTAGISVKLLHTELAVKETQTKDGKTVFKAFRDHDVHRVLENSGIHHYKFSNYSTGKEWFKIPVSVALDAIKAVKDNKPNLGSVMIDDDFEPIVLRPEQDKAVQDTIKQFKKGNRMLWNAKMRFGKTVAALALIKEKGYGKTIILTHRPVVDEGWFEDFKKIFHGNNNYEYGSKNNGGTIDYLLKTNKKIVYFASLQDLRGSSKVGGKYKKNSLIYDTLWDLVIVDEAHEGTTTPLGDTVIKEIIKEDSGYDTKLLELSGTPFNIMKNYEDNIFTWDYIMEQRCKNEWNISHFGDSNPYDELPELKIFTYDLGKIITNGQYKEIEDKAFNFREFFRIWTGDVKTDRKHMPEGVNKGDFFHEEDVLSFLNLITKDDKENHYPFSTERYRSLFKHTLWVVPGIKEAKALSKLMRQHPVFGCGMFDIVNIAGDGDEEEQYEEALSKVRHAIDNSNGNYTITITCGRLTTGVTVKEWTAVFMLAGSYSTSASSYLQTIFRVQSPCNMDGKIKTCCYVFDFAPDRTLKMVAESVSMSTKAGKSTENDKRILGEFLNYCPVISINGTEMKKYNTTKLLSQLKRVYAERAVQNGFDDTNLYNDELLKLQEIDLEKFKELQGIIGKTKASHNTKEINVNDQGFTNEEYEEIERIKNKQKAKRSPEEEQRLKELQQKNKQKNDAISILRGISIRMPLLIYGADIDIDEDITMERLVDIVDDSSWNEFMPKGVTKDKFKEFIKYYDKEIFIEAGRRIRRMALSADEYSPTERVKKIADIFSHFKNPDKETILTPWRVVNLHLSDCLGGYDFFNENHDDTLEEPRFINHGQVTADTLANKDAKILEINSKTGLYPLYVTYSIYRKKCEEYSKDELTLDLQNKLWYKTVRNNIFIICKTPMAKSITKRTLVGYKDKKINAHYFDDLINFLKNKPEKFIEKVLKPSYWDLKGSDDMKFDAVVGNPPYQLMDGGNSASSTPIYNFFVENAKKLYPEYLSMIIPARWYAGGKGLDEFRNNMINDKHISKLYDYFDSYEIFPTADISGGICYFLWDKKKEYNECEVCTCRGGNLSSMHRPLLQKGSDTFIRFNEAIVIIEKVKKFKEKSFGDGVSSRKPFGFSTNPQGIIQNRKKGYIRIYAYPQNGYIEKNSVSKHIEWVSKYKVCDAKAYGERGNFPYNVIAKPFIAEPNSCCSETYIILGMYNDQKTANNVLSYIMTKFVRFLILLQKNTQDSPARVYMHVPTQNFSKSWTDEELYEKYGLSEDEIEFIESMIKPME